MGIGWLRSSAGDAVGDLGGLPARALLDAMPFDDIRLAEVRKVEIPVQFRRRPDLAGFDASVIARRLLDVVRRAPILEIELQILEKSGLVCFDGEMVMGLALLDQVSGQWALRQQGVGADVLAFTIDPIQQGDGDLDLVGLFGLIPAFDGQGPYFFWV